MTKERKTIDLKLYNPNCNTPPPHGTVRVRLEDLAIYQIPHVLLDGDYKLTKNMRQILKDRYYEHVKNQNAIKIN